MNPADPRWWSRKRRAAARGRTLAAFKAQALADPSTSEMRKARLRAGMTMPELAARIRYEAGTVRRYEVRELPAPFVTRMAIATAVKVPPGRLFDENGWAR